MMKKQLIMEKALELFTQQGFEATSVQQITDYCGISKGAFYLSFKSKTELVLALIDRFMLEITSDIDHVVKNTDNKDLLYEFYFTMLSSFHKYSAFPKLFIKDRLPAFNKELILKLTYYDKLISQIILSMIERLYGEEIHATKYDLIYCVKGFMKTYSELFFHYNLPVDLNILSQSLAEKTTILAKHSRIPFISQELMELAKTPINTEMTKEQLLVIIKAKIEEVEEAIEKESLILLREHLLTPTLSPAIEKGLIENLKNHPQCKWISSLLQSYYRMA